MGAEPESSRVVSGVCVEKIYSGKVRLRIVISRSGAAFAATVRDLVPCCVASVGVRPCVRVCVRPCVRVRVKVRIRLVQIRLTHVLAD